MTGNEERRSRAAEAIRAAYPDDEDEYRQDWRASDLIADLLHLAGDDVTDVLARALMHFEAERLGDAK